MNAHVTLFFAGGPTGELKTLRFRNVHGLITSIRKMLPFADGHGWDLGMDRVTFERLGGYETKHGETVIPVNDPVNWPHNNSTLSVTVTG